MHDAIAAERLGVPALGIMTDQFASAADEMRRALGMPDYPFATVEHPISSASNRALEQRAESVLDQSLHHIVRG